VAVIMVVLVRMLVPVVVIVRMAVIMVVLVRMLVPVIVIVRMLVWGCKGV